MNNYIAEKIANEWLRENGLDAKMLKDTPKLYLQAQVIAKNLLNNDIALLMPNEIIILTGYMNAMSTERKRKKVTRKKAYRVMNIGTSVNRNKYALAKKAK